jgi:hypothetical protein
MRTIYRKTPKGITEIETRALRLAPRLRSALILVDGKRSDDELSAMILSEPAATLAGLLEGGFIEILSSLAEPAPRAAKPAAPGEAAPAAGAAALRSFEGLRREAGRELSGQLGPLADDVTLKIERAKSMPELQPLLVLGAQMLQRLKGAAVAQAFATRFIGQPQTQA